MPNDRTIEAQIVNNHLSVPNVDADMGVNVFWEIRENGSHPVITSITEKCGSDHIFRVQPHPIGNGRWQAIINSTCPDYSQYLYAIVVRDSHGTYPLDPKIAVKSTKEGFVSVSLIVSMVLIAATFVGTRFFYKKR